MSPQRYVGPIERWAVVFALTVVFVVGVLAVVALHSPRPGGSTVQTSSWRPNLSPGRAGALLDELPTGKLERGVAYDRTADFGPAWADVDHNGCDTRNDMLRRDLTRIKVRTGTHGCVVIAGRYDEPYTGAEMTFSKAQASEIQIDHLVPLHAAWMLGAFRWSPELRLAYANDPMVLISASGPANQDKGDRLADSWKPTNRGAWCAYAANTVAIHHKYVLPVTSSERSALKRMLATCV